METGFNICLIHSGNGTDLKRMFHLSGTILSQARNFILRSIRPGVESIFQSRRVQNFVNLHSRK